MGNSTAVNWASRRIACLLSELVAAGLGLLSGPDLTSLHYVIITSLPRLGLDLVAQRAAIHGLHSIVKLNLFHVSMCEGWQAGSLSCETSLSAPHCE